MTKRPFFVIIFLFFLLFNCFANGNRELKNTDNEKLRIISLAPNATEIICKLGAEDCLVGRTDYCNFPSSVSSIQSIGDMYYPNFEMIVALQPDVVIATSIISQEDIDKLNSYGIKTYQFFHEYEGLEGNLTLIKEIGSVINREQEADALINQLRSIKEKVIEKCKLKPQIKCAVIITWGDWGDYAATGDTFIEDIIETANGINIAKNAKYWAISKELLIKEDPDIIFITDTSNENSTDMIQAFKSTQPYNTLKASKNNNVYLLNSDSLTRQSYRSFELLEEIAEIINHYE